MPILSEAYGLSWKGPKLSWPKVFALPAGFSGCAFWRYRLPLNKLKKLGSSLDINIADNPNKSIRLEDIQQHIGNSDIITMQSPGYKDAVTLINLYKSEGKKVVVDYDDFSFDLSEGNPRYAELGTKETEILGPDGKPAFRWRDQENGFDLKSNQEKYEAFKLCLEKADLITTTTEYLADKFRKHNPNVAICPNSIDFDLWRPIPRPPIFNQVRIGWFGGDSHFVDLKIFKNLFPRLVTKHPDIKIVIQAPPVPEWVEYFKCIPQKNLEWYGWADLRYYTLFLASRHFDIGLCPLADNEFNKCKSNIKALEFVSMGAAVVAQDMVPYSNHLKEGETGFLAGNEDEWFEKVSRLIEEKELREKIAINAFKDVQANHNLDFNCRSWERAYIDLLEGRPQCGSILEQSFLP